MTAAQAVAKRTADELVDLALEMQNQGQWDESLSLLDRADAILDAAESL